MTDPIHEQLSAFLDGELSAAESELLIKRIERDSQLQVLLERYVLAGEAMRSTAVQARPSRDFAVRVSTAIASDSVPGRARMHIAQWLKPVAGGAIAAGVAAVALVSLQMTPQIASQMASMDATQGATQNLPRDGVNTLTTVSTNNTSLVAGQQATNLDGASFVVPASSDRAVPPFQIVGNGRLANFVVAHSEYSSPLGRRNVLTSLVADDTSLEQGFEQLAPEDQPTAQQSREQQAKEQQSVTPATKSHATNPPMISRGPR